MAFRPRSRLPLIESPVGHVTGLAVAVGGLGMIVAAGVGALSRDPDAHLLLSSGLVVGVPAALLFWRTSVPERISTVAIFGAVTTSWVALIFASTVPYLATGTFEHFDDALFEAVSGITTTGATVLPSIEAHGPAILFWRQITQWLGGLGVVVLAVAVLPVLAVGGLELLRAETPGPTSERIAPRVRETAQRLWFLYLGLTLAAGVGFLLAGMKPYDAAAHSLTMVSTGGFSPYDRSIAHFESAAVEWTGIAIMFVGAASFPLLWHGFRGRPGRLLRSVEFRAYFAFLAGMSLVGVAWNVSAEGFGHETVRHTTFAVISASTSSGFTVADYTEWAAFPQLLLLFGMAIGGMTLSTSGGFTVFRMLAVLGYARRQLIQQLHPRAVSVVRLGRETVPDNVVGHVVGFFGLYMAIGALATILTAASGVDLETSISAGTASIGNEGPGLGQIGPADTYLSIGRWSRGVLMLTMLIGRLEIVPVLLAFVALARSVERQRSRFRGIRRGARHSG